MIYLDLETTGLKGQEHDVIEICLIKENDSGNVIDKMHYYINTKLKIDSFITELNGISNQFLSDKPYFDKIGQEIINFIGSETLVGHNINNFDLPFLNCNLIKYGFEPIANPTIDTMLLAKKIDNAEKYAKGYKLIDLCKKYKINFDEKKMHNAVYDTELTRSLYKILNSLA